MSLIENHIKPGEVMLKVCLRLVSTITHLKNV